MYGATPPVALTVASPVHKPRQNTLVEFTILVVNAAGVATKVEVVSLHPLPSVISILYVPAQRLLTVEVDGVPGASYHK